MTTLLQWVQTLRALVWGMPTLVLLVGTGLYFSIGTRFFQIRCLPLWIKSTLLQCFSGKRRQTDTGVSQFAAMCTALAATIGTGNIAGVATALTLGGPGSIVWMCLCALLGCMTAFAENVLGIRYRIRGRDGAWHGGPMYYLRDGVGSPALAHSFAFFCLLASLGAGNLSQCNSISQGLSGVFHIPPFITAIVTAGLLGLALAGGLRGITRITALLVPVMALFYLGGAMIILIYYRAALPNALGQMVREAFSWTAGAGGAVGYSVSQAIRIGVSRGVFSNEAGMGSSVLVHTAAQNTTPCIQGMWAIFEVFFDTILMCTLTALVILTTGVDYTQQTGAQLTAHAFSCVFGKWGAGFIAVSLALFAFSTLLGWSYYGQCAAAWLFGEKSAAPYRVLFVFVAAAGCLMKLELAWGLSDLFNGLMVIPNLAGVLVLRREVLGIFSRDPLCSPTNAPPTL